MITKTPATLAIGVALLCSLATAQAGNPQKNDVTPRVLRVYEVSKLVHRDTEKSATAQPASEPAKEQPAHKDVVVAKTPILGNVFRDRQRPTRDDGIPQPVDALVTFIRAFVEPGLDPGDIVQSVGKDGIVVRGSLSQHSWIDAFLARNRREMDRMIMVEMRLLEMSPESQRALIDPVLAAQNAQARTNTRRAQRYALFESSAKTSAFLDRVMKSDKVDMLTAPSCLVRLGSHLRVWAGEKVSYIKDFRTEIAKDGSGTVIADPVIDVVHDGQLFEGVCAVLPNGRLGIDFAIVRSDLKRPIPQFDTSLGVGAKVTIQLPEVQVAKLATSVEFRDGDTALFCLPPLGKRRVVVLIKLAIVRPDPGGPVDKEPETRRR